MADPADTYVDVTDRAPCFPFYFRQVKVGPHRNFAYAIGDPATKQAALIDCAFHMDRLASIVERDGYRVTHAFATHAHDDHAGGLDALLARGASLSLHASWAGYPRAEAAKAAGRLALVDDGADVMVGRLPVRMLHTPGHTPESCCLLVGAPGSAQALLGGDTLFVNSAGRCDLSREPAVRAEEQMFAAMSRIRALSTPGSDITVFPGHDYAGFPNRALAAQVRENPALAVTDLATWRAFWFLRAYD